MKSTPIVDTHVHLWDPTRLGYDWLRGLPTLNRTFLLDDFRKASDAANIESFVFVECGCDSSQAHEEVAMVTRLAAAEPRLQGIVAQAPLEKGSEVREDLANLAANSLVKGVRRITQGEADLEFCNQPRFVEGVRTLAEFGLTCDLCIKHTQLESTIRLVRNCPEVWFVLDHLGKPDIRSGEREPWDRQLQELASLPNAWCKLSGLVTEADLTHWTYNDIEFYLQHALACFGAERLMYGGDWPVVTLAASYSRWIECTERALDSFSASDRQKVYRDNARHFYKLEKGDCPIPA